MAERSAAYGSEQTTRRAATPTHPCCTEVALSLSLYLSTSLPLYLSTSLPPSLSLKDGKADWRKCECTHANSSAPPDSPSPSAGSRSSAPASRAIASSAESSASAPGFRRRRIDWRTVEAARARSRTPSYRASASCERIFTPRPRRTLAISPVGRWRWRWAVGAHLASPTAALVQQVASPPVRCAPCWVLNSCLLGTSSSPITDKSKTGRVAGSQPGSTKPTCAPIACRQSMYAIQALLSLPSNLGPSAAVAIVFV
eukprot:COSAG02_NODE_109_length_36250_cov_121.168903_29_plen_256_part_00